MKIVKIEMELIIDDEIDTTNKKSIAEYLNQKLYQDPEFFGDFDEENITVVQDEI